jgi:hypothetical protein
MKSHSQSRDLPGRAATLPRAYLGLRVVRASRTTNLDPRFTNHESQFTLRSPLVSQHRRFLISSRPVSEMHLTRSQQTRKPFLISSFSAVWRLRHIARVKKSSALRTALTLSDGFDAGLVFRRGWFLGFRCRFRFRGPGRHYAINAGVSDGVAEMVVRVVDAGASGEVGCGLDYAYSDAQVKTLRTE